MTREEFMDHARFEIAEVFSGKGNRLMNLIEQAWAEGKKNAEADSVRAIIEEAMRRMEPPETISADAVPNVCSSFHHINRGPNEYEDRCWGVPETPICTCGGDRKKCNFYQRETD